MQLDAGSVLLALSGYWISYNLIQVIQLLASEQKLF